MKTNPKFRILHFEQKATKETKSERRPLRSFRFLLCATLLLTGGARGDTFTNLNFAIRLSSAGQMELAWDTATNAAYRLESCPSLARPAWSPGPTDWRAGDGLRFATNLPLPADPLRFYRVAVSNTPPPAPSPISWVKNLGGTNEDFGYSVETTSDGGYLIGGETEDAWLLREGFVAKVSRDGGVQWTKHLGGISEDRIQSVKQTSDEAYICAGYTYSSDLPGHHGYYDAWLVKFDTNRVIQWQKCFGGSYDDAFYSIQQTTDGGFIATGYTESTNGNVSGQHGWRDAWVVKTDAQGNLQWQRCFGGRDYDEARQLIQTADGGYAFAGLAYSTDGDFATNHGDVDGWVVKLSTNGVVQWQRLMGGSSSDEFLSMQETADGGLIAAGLSYSNDGDVSTNWGGSDGWVAKLDSAGNTQWQKSLGGSTDDFFNSIGETTDGGYVMAGLTLSSDNHAVGQHGLYDAFVSKLDTLGVVQWSRCFGGSNYDLAYSVHPTEDGGCIFVGYTDSCNGDIDPSGYQGGFDIWAVKLLPTGLMSSPAHPSSMGKTCSVYEDTPFAQAAPGVLANDLGVGATNLTATLVTGPTNGSVSLAADGGFTYTPATNYNGPDCFVYAVSNGVAGLGEASVQITVVAVNDAPVLPPQGDRVVAALTTLSVTNTAWDADPPSATTLTYTLSVTNGVGVVTNASISAQGIITWTPTAGQAGSVNGFTTRVTDGAAWGTNWFNVEVTP